MDNDKWESNNRKQRIENRQLEQNIGESKKGHLEMENWK